MSRTKRKKLSDILGYTKLTQKGMKSQKRRGRDPEKRGFLIKGGGGKKSEPF